ncbi:leucine-rich repeat protein [Anaerobutyricum hallii]|uniref:leucine-rich repeat protein n=2 Tax=Anaerobutyricum hallii TaxID=39488 RepID=UPI0035206E89
MFETLWTDMSGVSRNCKWDDISIAVRTVMSDGISGQLKRIGESLVSKAFNKNIQAEKVQSALALDYVNHAKEYSDYCANVYDEATDSLSKSKKVVSLFKKGSGKVGDTLEWVAEDEDIEEFAKAINAIFSYGDDLKVEQDLKKILKSSEVMKKVSSVFKTSGKAISAYQVAVSIEILRITTEDTQKHYMSLVDKDSTVYQGLKINYEKIKRQDAVNFALEMLDTSGITDAIGWITVYQGLKINYEKIKRQDAVNFALEMLDTSGITDAIGWITAKVTGAGTTASVTVAVVDLIYTGLNFILKKAGVIDVQDYLKVQYALLDQSWLKLAVSNQRLNIANNVYNTATLKNNYQDAFELYLSCMLQTPGYMEDYSGSDSYYKKLKKDIKKYESKLTYKNYIQSCLQNANASYSYTLSGDKATITKVNPGTGKSARVSSPFALNVMAMENEDSYCLDIPSEVDGYEVEAVNTDLFDNKTEVFAVTVPDTVTTIKEGAFQDCTALKQVFLENGLKTIETNAFAGCEDLSIINVPDTVNIINENAFGDNISIEAATDSDAYKYAEQNGNIFNGREKTVAAISVKKTMDKTEYAMSEPIDLTGLELTVTYVDGTTKDIKEGFTGDFTAKQIGRNEVVLYYNGVKTKTTVQVRSEQCEYTVLYQDTCGEKIHENVTGSGTTGETITLSIPKIAGYTPVETNIKQILGETNVFKVIYSVAKKKDIGEAGVSYKKEHTETGQEIRPAVEVRYKGLLLKADTDYELEYNNNIKPGKGNIWIAGIGDYEGVQLCNFVIKQKKTAVVKPDTSNKKIQKITLSAISKQIAAGKKVTLKSTVLSANASNKKLTWKSSNTKVATVTQGGVVTLKKNTGGKKVTITATATDGSRKAAFWQITSMKGIVKKVKITGSKSVKAGKKLKLKAKVTATKKANTKLRWTSSNTKYATVNAKGIVKTKKTAKGKSVKITAMATDGSGKKQSVKIKIKK